MKKLIRVWQERGFRGSIGFLYQSFYKRLFKKKLYSKRLNFYPSFNPLLGRTQIILWRSLPSFCIILFSKIDRFQDIEATIQSIVTQLYPKWNLLIVHLAEYQLNSLPRGCIFGDPRISIIQSSESNWVVAINQLINIIWHDYFLLVDVGDELANNALFEVAKLLQTCSEVDFIYSDEDYINSQDQRTKPLFKPNWSPEYFQSWMYTRHLHVYRTEVVRELNGFQADYPGAEVYDLLLRLAEKTQAILHIPKVLYHQRKHCLSLNESISECLLNQSIQRSLADLLARSDYPGWIETTPYPQVFRIRRCILETPLISIVIPSAGKVVASPEGDRCLLENCIRSIRTLSTYSQYEFIVVDGYDIPDSVLISIAAPDLRLVRCREPFNFSHRINQGVALAKGTILVLLNDDIEVITPDWLESMLEFAQQQEIGVVGAKLLYPNGRIQHIGVTIQNGTPEHIYHQLQIDKTGYLYTTIANRNCLAVTAACLMIRREIFDQINGMDEEFPLNYNDVDLCLKAYAAGYRNVVTPYAQLTHYESVSRQKGLLPNEWKKFNSKWSTFLRSLKQDPYINPNLTNCLVPDEMI